MTLRARDPEGPSECVPLTLDDGWPLTHIGTMAETLKTAGSGVCPTCGKPAEQLHRPFCSKRCKDVDLNRWLSGVYVARGREEEGDEGDERAPLPGPGDEQP